MAAVAISTTLLLYMFLYHQPHTLDKSRVGPSTAFSSYECDETDIHWATVDGERLQVSEQHAFARNTALLMCVRSAGTLHLRLKGSEALGRGPWIVIAQYSHILFDGEVVSELDTNVLINEAGPVLLAFGNDLYRGINQDRNFWILETTFTVTSSLIH